MKIPPKKHKQIHTPINISNYLGKQKKCNSSHKQTRTAWALSIILALAACGEPNKHSEISKTYKEKDVIAVLDTQLQGWNHGNINQFMEGYVKDSSVRFITQKGLKTSWLEILNSYKKNYATPKEMGHLIFIRDEFRWIDSMAGISQVIGRWRVVKENNDTVSGRFSLIFVHTSNGPRIAIDHTW